jgi:hypothetical protein
MGIDHALELTQPEGPDSTKITTSAWNAAHVISGNLGVITVDNLTFPSTQISSAGVNVLDDYEEGTWTPELTFATPGDLSVVYIANNGGYVKIGRMVMASFRMYFTTFTHSTASGEARIAGLPFTAQGHPTDHTGVISMNVPSPPVGTILNTAIHVPNLTTYGRIFVGLSGASRIVLTISHLTSGSLPNMIGAIAYPAT